MTQLFGNRPRQQKAADNSGTDALSYSDSVKLVKSQWERYDTLDRIDVLWEEAGVSRNVAGEYALRDFDSLPFNIRKALLRIAEEDS